VSGVKGKNEVFWTPGGGRTARRITHLRLKGKNVRSTRLKVGHGLGGQSFDTPPLRKKKEVGLPAGQEQKRGTWGRPILNQLLQTGEDTTPAAPSGRWRGPSNPRTVKAGKIRKSLKFTHPLTEEFVFLKKLGKARGNVFGRHSETYGRFALDWTKKEKCNVEPPRFILQKRRKEMGHQTTPAEGG